MLKGRMGLRTCIAVCTFLMIMTSSCADLPRDQENTVNNIRQSGKMRIGLIENPPWVIRTSGEPTGAEVELMRQFAAGLGAQPEWHWGGEEKLLGALEKFELDAVVGGISSSTPWRKRIGLTSVYYEEAYNVGFPADTPTPSDLKGREIAVLSDARLAALVREKGATPIIAASAEELDGKPLAAAEWKLDKLGLIRGGKTLHTDSHIVATPPGENNMVMLLDQFLSSKGGEIALMLQQQPEVSQ
jgi:polar amino acid transport system substrate-binding protein